jgi:iron complex outermembrane recepter protein
MKTILENLNRMIDALLKKDLDFMPYFILQKNHNPTLVMKKLRNNLFLLAFTLVASISLQAQKINGIVSDASGKAQEFATVMLMKAQDSTLTKGAVTDMDGKFEIENVSAGSYFVNVSIVGFKNYASAHFDFDGKKDLSLEKINLTNLDTELKEVTVTARKPMIEVKADRTVFNVESSPTAAGLSALELLRKSPGVNVDKDENIQLKGKPNVIIYINGKPSNMSGRDLAAFLKGLNANDIEAIEMISNPGARFDAEGNAGVINIKLKKNKKLGTNGNISLGYQYGLTPKYDGAASVNYRDAKWNLFSNYSYNWGNWNNTLALDNTVRVPNTEGLYNFWQQRSTQGWNSKAHNYKVGADYTLDSKNTIGFIFNGGFSNPEFNSASTTTIGKVKPNTMDFVTKDSVLQASGKGLMDNQNYNINLNYRYADTSGRELNLDADYANFDNNADNSLPNIYRNGELTRILTERNYRNMSNTKIDIKSFKLDYEQPLSATNKKAGKLGVGFKISDVKTSNNFDFYNVLNNKDYLDTSRTNFFTYTEAIQAGYANYNTQLGKFGVQLGLRGERTVSKGDLKTKQARGYRDVDSSYFNLFPSVALSYALSPKHAFNLTYRYSLDRPDYQDLNPFENRLDELTYERGNTTLRPQYTNTYELGYTFMGFASLSASYAKTKDFFTQYTDTDVRNGVTSFFITKANLANRENFGLSLSSPIPINKWWNGFLNAWWNHTLLKANLGEGKDVDIKADGGGFYMQHTFSLPKSFTIEVDGFMNFGGLWGNFVSQTQGVANIGVVKKIWDGDGQIKVSYNDIFKTSQWKAYTELGSLYMDARGTWEGQKISVNFTYRFGNKNVQGARQRKTGLDDEQKRVKSGKG